MKRSELLTTLICFSVWTGSVLAQQSGDPPGATAATGPVAMPSSTPVDFIAAMLVQNGTVQLEPASVVARGKIGNEAASGVTLRSATDRFNGLLVRGGSTFTLADSRIDLSGKGLNDFAGIAAGALVKDQATMILRNVNITTHGAVSTAATATDSATMKVYHSTLTAEGGPMPSGYVRRIGPGMMEPPTPLGVVGTARTSLTMGSAKSYFYDSTIIADGWGALSTDAARGAYLEANRCNIIVRRSGYGTYADKGAIVVINDSTMDAATFGGVIAGQASLTFNQLRLKSAGNAVMIHNVMGSAIEIAELTIRGGSIATTNAAILVKSANVNILVEGTKITARNGDLLLAVVNDDSFATKVNGQKVAGIQATFRSAVLSGNLLHLDTERTMTVTLASTQLRGTIKNVALSLDARSQWTATANSELQLIAPTQLAQIDAAKGISISATAEQGLIASGSYTLRSGGMLIVHSAVSE